MGIRERWGSEDLCGGDEMGGGRGRCQGWTAKEILEFRGLDKLHGRFGDGVFKDPGIVSLEQLA